MHLWLRTFKAPSRTGRGCSRARLIGSHSATGFSHPPARAAGQEDETVAEPPGPVDVVHVAGVDPELQAVAVLGPVRPAPGRLASCRAPSTDKASPASLQAARTSAQRLPALQFGEARQPVLLRPARRPWRSTADRDTQHGRTRSGTAIGLGEQWVGHGLSVCYVSNWTSARCSFKERRQVAAGRSSVVRNFSRTTSHSGRSPSSFAGRGPVR